MHLLASTLAATATAAALFTSTTTAALLTPRQETNNTEPWQLTRLTIYTPSSRPLSYPFGTLHAEITDPNAHLLGTAQQDGTQVSVPAGNTALNCTHQWYIPDGFPLDTGIACAPSGDGYWVMYVQAGSTGGWRSTDFELRFVRVAEARYRAEYFERRLEGEAARFSLETNLGGQCGGSGVCSWGLRGEEKPFGIGFEG